MTLNLSWSVAPFQRLSTLLASCSSVKVPRLKLSDHELQFSIITCHKGGIRRHNESHKFKFNWPIINIATLGFAISRQS